MACEFVEFLGQLVRLALPAAFNSRRDPEVPASRGDIGFAQARFRQEEVRVAKEGRFPHVDGEPAPGTKEAVDKELIDSIKLPDRTPINAMLSNGARFYIDHAHPEYSTPECASLRDLIAADVAGQVFLAQAAEQVNRSLMPGQRFSLYRNNTDFHGTSYGCHENYQMNAPVYEALFGNQQHLLFTFLTP